MPNDINAQHVYEPAPDVLCLTHWIVNICLYGHPAEKAGEWTLIDAGLAFSADVIEQAAEQRFGKSHRPQAIILTHGHFDHIGSCAKLAERWNVPVYAHGLELPYLNGEADYAPPDPTVGGGLIAAVSPLFPNEGIDLKNRLHTLPSDGSVPGMNGWRWIHTPGHTPGHISLFRDVDRLLLAGDAFTTVEQESAMAVLAQKQEVHGPPAYFTVDWRAAGQSVEELWKLEPQTVASGHGAPMSGEELAEQLKSLALHFKQQAVPAQGRYVP